MLRRGRDLYSTIRTSFDPKRKKGSRIKSLMGADCGTSMSTDDGIECPVCWEGFNDAENTPYVLWCGHSLCRNCVMGLQWAVIKLPFCPVQLPLFIACPWCQFLTLRMMWKGKLKYPCKNFFLLWIVESLKGENVRQRPQGDLATVLTQTSVRSVPTVVLNLRPRHSQIEEQQRPTWNFLVATVQGGWNFAQWQILPARVLASVVQITAKLPLVFLFLFIIFYVLPFSAFVLAVYAVVTVVFAVPSFLAVYFSYPSLDWLAREIVT
jgi:hypothetical protein